MIGVEIKLFSFAIHSLTVRRGVRGGCAGLGKFSVGAAGGCWSFAVQSWGTAETWNVRVLIPKGSLMLSGGSSFVWIAHSCLMSFPVFEFSFMLCVSQTALRRAGCSFPCNFSSSRLACVSSIKQIGMQRKKKGSRSEEDLFSLNGSWDTHFCAMRDPLPV